jgi:hypothetical protein
VADARFQTDVGAYGNAADFAGHFLSALRIDIGDYDGPGALGVEAPGKPFADAVRAAGHHRNFVPQHHSRL